MRNKNDKNEFPDIRNLYKQCSINMITKLHEFLTYKKVMQYNYDKEHILKHLDIERMKDYKQQTVTAL